MNTSPSEVLVEVQPGTSVDEAVPPGAQILQRLPPRLAIVAADEEGIRELRRSRDVSAVFAEDVPADALAQLDQASRAFAAGWNERRRPKERRGEGVHWDAPGFDAP